MWIVEYKGYENASWKELDFAVLANAEDEMISLAHSGYMVRIYQQESEA